MTVEFFCGVDSQNNNYPPEHHHEMEAVTSLIEPLWNAFHRSSDPLFLVLSNLQFPKADFVLLSERGIGVLELKHYPGQITARDDGEWFAGGRLIAAGANFKNPHQQVQHYADVIRNKAIESLIQRHVDKKNLISLPKVQTAICFSNPDSDISWFRDSSNKIIGQRPWEQLKVLTPGEITEWASCVRFGLPSVKIQGNRKVFDQLLLEKEAMIAFATNILNVREWLDIQDFLPTETYAYLYPLDDNNSPGISIKDREITVGRDHEKCRIAISENFSQTASRVHFRLVKSRGDIWIEDAQSMNGTFVNNKRIFSVQKLADKDIITLGGPEPSDTVFGYQFRLKEKTPPLNFRGTGT